MIQWRSSRLIAVLYCLQEKELLVLFTAYCDLNLSRDQFWNTNCEFENISLAHVDEAGHQMSNENSSLTLLSTSWKNLEHYHIQLCFAKLTTFF